MLKEIKIELTNKCLRNCIHCSNQATNKLNNLQQLDFKDVVKVIEESHDMGVHRIVFTGGEPMQYDNLDLLIEIASNYKMQTAIYTFEYRTKESLEKYKKLIDKGLSQIIYSLADSLSKEENLSIYSNEEFFEKLLIDTKTKLGFHYVLTKDSYQEYKEVVKRVLNHFKDKNYFDKVSFLRFVPHGRGTEDMDLSLIELLSFKKYYLSLPKEIQNKIRLGSPWNILGIKNILCKIANEVMIIGFDGIAYPCDSIKYFYDLGISGNIKDKSLKELYNSEYFMNLRNLFVNNDYNLCQGGCLGQKIRVYYKNDDEKEKVLKKCYLQRDPKCLKNK